MQTNLSKALWRIYNRPNRPVPFSYGGNLPWDDIEFGKRMLAYHLSESDNAASRVSEQRLLQIDWMWEKLGLEAGQHLLDITCGPGLYSAEFAQRGLKVTGIDFSPVALDYARQYAEQQNVSEKCHFLKQDVRDMQVSENAFDAAFLIYGQLAVMTREEAQLVLTRSCAALKQGGRMCIELLNPKNVDKKNSTWWFTDDGRLWGDTPYLHLGERIWYEDEGLSLERFQIVHLESGELDEI
ncbi:MAG: SAM-dependent methyltransferase, partial [Candidatus Promineifilaceae bacterium]